MALNRAVRADREDIGRPHGVPWGHYPTLAAKRAAADTPPTTPGARLRGIGFVDLHGPTGLVIELRDETSIARLADGLRLVWGHVLRGVIEWLAYIAGRAGEGIGNFARRFVRQVIKAMASLGAQACLAPLQALPAPRALGEL
jgi:hypothetical protein